MSVEMVIAIAALITALFTGIAAVITASRTNKFIQQDAVFKNEKLDHISGLVNGKLKAALLEIEKFRGQIDTSIVNAIKKE